jgi:hypothetical protein
MSFVPAGTKVESGGGDYFKPPVGKSKVRILGDAEIGYEYWTQDKKPVRLRKMPTVAPSNIGHSDDGTPNPIRPFWAVAVWDYSDSKVKIWGITQATIMNQVLELFENEDWGHPNQYDITIGREGEGFKTKYSVTPSPKKAIPDAALASLEATPIDLRKQFQLAAQPVAAGMTKEELDQIDF